ncbi:hypothetical protein ANCCAN_21261, partial [Ancylostoma caninum]
MLELMKTQSVNQQLRDQIRVLESRCEQGRHIGLPSWSARRERGLVHVMERLQADLINERNTSEEH